MSLRAFVAKQSPVNGIISSISIYHLDEDCFVGLRPPRNDISIQCVSVTFVMERGSSGSYPLTSVRWQANN